MSEGKTGSIEDGDHLTWRSAIHHAPGRSIVWGAAEGIHGAQAASILLAGHMIGMTPYQAIMILAWDPDLRKVTIPEEAIFREPDGSWTVSEEIQPGAGIHVLEAPRAQAGGIGRAPVPEPDPWTPGPGGPSPSSPSPMERLSRAAEGLREIRQADRPPEWTPEQALEALHLFPQGSKPPEVLGERFEGLDDIRNRVRDQIRKLGHPFAVIVAQFGQGTLPALDRPSDPTEADLIRIGQTVEEWTSEIERMEAGEKIGVRDWRIWISGSAVWTSIGEGESERSRLVDGLGPGVEPRARLLEAHRMILDQRRQRATP